MLSTSASASALVLLLSTLPFILVVRVCDGKGVLDDDDKIALSVLHSTSASA